MHIWFRLLTELQMMVTFHHHTACNKRIDRTIVITVIIQDEIVRFRSGTILSNDNACHNSTDYEFRFIAGKW